MKFRFKLMISQNGTMGSAVFHWMNKGSFKDQGQLNKKAGLHHIMAFSSVSTAYLLTQH